MFRSIKGWIIGGVLATILTVSGLGYKHYNDLQSNVVRLTADNQSITQANVQLNKVYTDLQQKLTEEKKQREEDFKSLISSREEVQRLEKLFSKHDLNRLLQKKPKLIIKKINRATKKSLKEVEGLILP